MLAGIVVNAVAVVVAARRLNELSGHQSEEMTTCTA